MIHLTHRKWRAIRVMDVASVKYLNRMFRDGWFIMPFGMDDVEYFIMRVPIETPPTSRYPGPHGLVDVQTAPAMTVLVLTKGTRKYRQMASLAVRGDGWIMVERGRVPPDDRWRPVIRTSVEAGLLTIYERVEDAE